MKDQVVIVTGSGQGIGEATALRFSRDGASVVVVDIQEASGTGNSPRDSASRRQSVFCQG